MRKIRVVCDGLGSTGGQLAEMMRKRGIEIVGAIVHNPKWIGKDIGERVGIPNTGILISSDLESLLKEQEPDLVAISTRTAIADIADHVKTCIRCGVDVITTSEEAFYWPCTPSRETAAELDRMAKENGVTVYAGGIQDANWNVVPLAMASTCHEIHSISGVCTALVDDFGPAVMSEIGIGMKKEDFDEQMSHMALPDPDAFTVSCYALIAKLGLTAGKRSVRYEGIIREKAMPCPALGRDILPGELIGTDVTTTIETDRDLTVSCTFVSKLKEEGDTAYNSWEIKGVPDLFLKCDDMHGEIATTGAIINRIPDVLDARPGFLTACDMPVPYYRYDLTR